MVYEDKISKLPNDILGHILSILTTKKTVQTIVLSIWWQYGGSMFRNITPTVNDRMRKPTNVL